MGNGPRGKSRAIRLACCLAAWAALSCAGSGVVLGEGNGPNIISGKVTGPGGRFVENIEVTLMTQSGVPADVVYTDPQGEFTFRGVTDGDYHVIINDSRYRRADVTAHVKAMVDPLDHLYISLEPREQPPSESAPFAGGSQTISVEELRKRYPEKAVKEYTKGNAKMSHGDVKGAIAAFEKAVALAPEMYPALGNLGNAFLQSGRLPDAESAFQKALKANPDSAESFVNLGHVYFEMHKFDEATESLTQGLKRNPNDALGYFFLGMTDIAMEKTGEAEANLRRALDLDEGSVATAHLALANLYLKTRRTPQARKQLEDFLKLRPQDAQAGHVRDVLARMKAEGPQ